MGFFFHSFTASVLPAQDRRNSERRVNSRPSLRAPEHGLDPHYSDRSARSGHHIVIVYHAQCIVRAAVSYTRPVVVAPRPRRQYQLYIRVDRPQQQVVNSAKIQYYIYNNLRSSRFKTSKRYTRRHTASVTLNRVYGVCPTLNVTRITVVSRQLESQVRHKLIRLVYFRFMYVKHNVNTLQGTKINSSYRSSSY